MASNGIYFRGGNGPTCPRRTSHQRTFFLVLGICNVLVIYYVYITQQSFSKSNSYHQAAERKFLFADSNYYAAVENIEKRTKSPEVPCFKSPYVMCPTNLPKTRKSSADWGKWRTSFNTSARADNSIKIAAYQRPKDFIDPVAFNFDQCKEYPNCRYVGDITSNSPDVDVVVVHGSRKLESRDSTIRRWPHQIYVYMGWESPPNLGLLGSENSPWKNQFNATIHYRRDSDIFSPYFELQYTPNNNSLRYYVDMAMKKEKKIAWVVGHCETASNRHLYVDELKKHISVDIYGGCGVPCPKQPDYCGQDLNKYLFYLSFENTFCNEYVTEKYFKGFRHLVVPIVRGGAEYRKYFPPDTFVSTSDFERPAKLAQFLKKLSKDVLSYSRYLQALDSYRLTMGLNYFTCRLCEYLNTMNLHQPRHYDIRKWVMEGQCYSPPHDWV